MHSFHFSDFSSYNERRWFGQEISVDPFVVEMHVMWSLFTKTSLITLVVSFSSKTLILFAAILIFSSCSVWALNTWRPEAFMAALRRGFVSWYRGEPTLESIWKWFQNILIHIEEESSLYFCLGRLCPCTINVLKIKRNQFQYHYLSIYFTLILLLSALWSRSSWWFLHY